MSRLVKISILIISAFLLALTIFLASKTSVFAAREAEIANSGAIEFLPSELAGGNFVPDKESVTADKNRVTVDIASDGKAVQTVELKVKNGALEIEEITDLGGGGDIVKIPGRLTVNGREMKVTRISDDALEDINPRVIIFPEETERIDKEAFRDASRLERVIFLGRADTLHVGRRAFPSGEYAVYVGSRAAWDEALINNGAIGEYHYWAERTMPDGERMLRETSAYRGVENTGYIGLKDLYDAKILR